jgi:hypothetical protein
MNTKEALKTLDGMTADEIAVFLKKKDVKGSPMLRCHCPIAKYLKRRTGRVHEVTGVGCVREFKKRARYVKASSGVRDFVRQFDRGRYPDLELKPVEKKGA